MFPNKSYEEICLMSPDEIRSEMLRIWHELDFKLLTEEESKQAIDNLKMYKEVYTLRQYEDRVSLS